MREQDLGAADAPAAVVLATLGKPPDPGLEDLLGAVAAGIVRMELLRQARRWAAAIAPDRAFEANSAAAAAAALAEHAGPVLLVAPDVPGLDARVGHAALDDLAEGVGFVVGPSNDGTPYLIGFPSADLGLFEVLDRPRDEVFAFAAGLAGGMGMVRNERRLVSAADARAIAADPLLALELALPLAAGLDVRARRG